MGEKEEWEGGTEGAVTEEECKLRKRGWGEQRGELGGRGVRGRTVVGDMEARREERELKNVRGLI